MGFFEPVSPAPPLGGLLTSGGWHETLCALALEWARTEVAAAGFETLATVGMLLVSLALFWLATSS